MLVLVVVKGTGKSIIQGKNNGAQSANILRTLSLRNGSRHCAFLRISKEVRKSLLGIAAI